MSEDRITKLTTVEDRVFTTDEVKDAACGITVSYAGRPLWAQAVRDEEAGHQLRDGHFTARVMQRIHNYISAEAKEPPKPQTGALEYLEYLTGEGDDR